MIKLKRIYDVPSEEDGKRILIERLWPLEADVYLMKIHCWLKDLAPSYSLLEWLREHSKEWPQFREKYLKELEDPCKKKLIKDLTVQGTQGDLTLLYANEKPERT